MTQTAVLTASDGVGGNGFGSAVAISGDTVVVGAAGARDYYGAAYLFTAPASGWTDATQTALLTASDSTQFDGFGASVAVSGNTVLVGSTYADKIPGTTRTSGAVYVFPKSSQGWGDMVQTAKLSRGIASDSFGDSLAMRGDMAVIGATGPNGIRHGAAYIYVAPASDWTHAARIAMLTASDATASLDFFAASVAFSGDAVVVGADGADIGAKLSQGAVYVFIEPDTGWTDMNETAKLTASDGVAGDFFGTPALSGQTLVVGASQATYDSRTSTPGRGAAYVFGLNTLDPAMPSSSVNFLPATQTSLSFTVTWSGQVGTGGSRIASYDVVCLGQRRLVQPLAAGGHCHLGHVHRPARSHLRLLQHRHG